MRLPRAGCLFAAPGVWDSWECRVDIEEVEALCLTEPRDSDDLVVMERMPEERAAGRMVSPWETVQELRSGFLSLLRPEYGLYGNKSPKPSINLITLKALLNSKPLINLQTLNTKPRVSCHDEMVFSK